MVQVRLLHEESWLAGSAIVDCFEFQTNAERHAAFTFIIEVAATAIERYLERRNHELQRLHLPLEKAPLVEESPCQTT